MGMSHEDLRVAAAAATPGPWKPQTEGHYDQKHAAARAYDEVRATGKSESPDIQWSDLSFVLTPDESLNVAMTGNGPKSTQNAAYIALASPDRILALCEENDELRAALRAMVEFADGTNVWDEYRVDGMLECIGEARAALEGKP